MRLGWLFGIALLAIASLGGCAPSGPSLEGPAVFPGGVPVTDEHTLAPNDEIEVRFPYYPDLNDRVLVGPDGRLSLQMVNSVTVGGLTVGQATKLLNERYAQVIKDPNLTVTLRTYAPQEIFVDGWVNNPGLVRSDVPLTVSRALAQAGGVKSGAHTDDVLILRRSSDNKIFYYEVSLGNFAGAGGQDPLLKSYDVVYVPQTVLGSLNDFLVNYVRNVPFYFQYTIQ
ncbi:MAG: polysaccharide export protein [Alphaproteobacteria bacterium]|nr:polysaccharide export protein [Alphaproteobacteria bacterium]